MSISVFPAPSSATSPSAFAVSVPSANTPRRVVRTLSAGIYQVSVSPATSTAFVYFTAGSTFIGSTTTVGGTINFNLAAEATNIFVQSSNANDVVTINLTASVPINNTISGTLDTITTSGTYSQTGLLWVLAIGGGAGGTGATGAWGPGGGAGGLAMFYGNVPTSTTVTIGNAGLGSAANSGLPGGSGGTTSFGSYAIATGGSGSNPGLGGGSGGIGTVGTAVAGGGDGGGSSGSQPGQVVPNVWRSIINGTHGGGGGGGTFSFGGQGGGIGAGSGIGTGGNGSSSGGAAGGNATGYGSGGGGGTNNNGNEPRSAGGNGSPGVVYVLRNF